MPVDQDLRGDRDGQDGEQDQADGAEDGDKDLPVEPRPRVTDRDAGDDEESIGGQRGRAVAPFAAVAARHAERAVGRVDQRDERVGIGQARCWRGGVGVAGLHQRAVALHQGRDAFLRQIERLDHAREVRKAHRHHQRNEILARLRHRHGCRQDRGHLATLVGDHPADLETPAFADVVQDLVATEHQIR